MQWGFAFFGNLCIRKLVEGVIMGKVKVVTDSTCDLSEDLLKEYDIAVLPLYIVMDDVSYKDMVEATPEKIYEWADRVKKTPGTSAPSIEAAVEFLRPFKEAGDEVIYLGISEDMSTTLNVFRLAADELEYERFSPVNSMNLSTGIGLQLLRAADMAKEGKSLEEITEAISEARVKVNASFVVDTLTYLARGGRCTQVTALLANTLKLKPCIEVHDGTMGVGTKYRGSTDKAILKYVKDREPKLLNADPKRVFITHSGAAPEVVSQVRSYLESLNHFENIYETRAGGVISSHCGPGTLGVLFYEN